MKSKVPKLMRSLVVLGVAMGINLVAFAEEAPMEEVVVTGSLIKGTPEDAALPVEVFTAAEMEDLGAPTALEFVKSLTVSGPTYGESYYWGGSGTNASPSYNLRGLGVDKTLSLFNGRRAFENSGTIPYAAIARVEILKDGAAVTYGADATGGVVNYITRDNFEGLEVSTQYKVIDGSAGDWSASLLGGFQIGDTNLLVDIEWDHRSELDMTDRSWADQPYWVNPSPWSSLTNLAGWLPRGTLPATPGNTSTGEWGAAISGIKSDFTQSSCEAVGGIYGNSYTCYYDYAPYYNLVDEVNTYRVYLQANTVVNDRTNFYARVNFARTVDPHSYGSPAQPVIRGPARGTGATYQFYVPVTNPYVAEFMTRAGYTSAAVRGFTPVTYRAFAHGGNDVFAEGNSQSTPNTHDYRYTHLSTGINGSFTNDIGYDLGFTFNHYASRSTVPDIVGYRLQEAMYGFGGPDCDVDDEDPVRFGTQNATVGSDAASRAALGCYYWNPFASAWKGQPVWGLANPSYVEGSENSVELARWIFNERESETFTWNATIDLVFNGATPLELGGGNAAWGAGLQWRQLETRDANEDPLYNGRTPCAWPEQVPVNPTDVAYTGCTPDEPGPFVFFSTNLPSGSSRTQYSYFLELNLPVLDSLYFVAAARYEDFGHGLDTTVYKVSGKWDVTQHLALRGAYGTNYQAPAITIVPGELVAGVASYTIAGGDWRGYENYTRTDLVPETATVWSLGVIWQSEGFTDGSEFRFIVDYFDIETEDEITALATANEIAGAVFHIPADGTNSKNDGSNLADCSHPLVGRVTFNAPCVQGTTDAGDFSSIRRDYGNGPGQHTAGYDLQTDYGFPAFSGDLKFSLTATIVEKFEFTAAITDGYVINPGEDRLGNLNFVANAAAAPKVRANLSANYAFGVHNARLVYRFVEGVKDERYGAAGRSILGTMPGTTSAIPNTHFGVNGDDWMTWNLHYNGDFSFGTLTFSIANLTDEDPPGALEEPSYDPLIANPLGRTFELGYRKQF